MAADKNQKIIVEELPGGGKRWRRARKTIAVSSPHDPKSTFSHKVGNGHNLIRLFELFIEAWARCRERQDGSLLIPDSESASELYGLCGALNYRIFRELARIPQTRGGGIYYDDHPGDVRHILHACMVMGTVLTSMKLNDAPIVKGLVLPFSARMEFDRAVRILALWFNSAEDVDRVTAATTAPPEPPAMSVDHAADFSWLVVRGKTYEFSKKQQAQVIKALFGEWEKGGKQDGLGLREATLGEVVQSASDRFRIQKVFSGHPALNSILRRSSKGAWALYLSEPT